MEKAKESLKDVRVREYFRKEAERDKYDLEEQRKRSRTYVPAHKLRKGGKVPL